MTSLSLTARAGVFPVAVTVLLALGTRVRAQADINNGTVRLGINKDGSLIINAINAPVNSGPTMMGVSKLSIRLMPPAGMNYDAEGDGNNRDAWGVGDTISNTWGGAMAGTPTSLTNVTLTSTPNTAVSTVNAGAGGIFKVTHDFTLSPDPNLYLLKVTIQNVSAAPVNARYRRSIDWDPEPTPSIEFITIQGATLPGVLSFTDFDGPLGAENPLLPPVGTNGDVINLGPVDKGATLTLDLGTLAPGASTTFNTYYGAAPTRAAALASLASVGIPGATSGYTLAQPSTPGNPASAAPNTFIYGFFTPTITPAGVTVTESGGSTNVTEGGASDTYTVMLNTLPTASVTITLNSGTQMMVLPATLPFSPANWNTPQTVTVIAVDDALVEGVHTGSVTHMAASMDAAYNGIVIANVIATITDNDVGPCPAEGSFPCCNGPPGPEGSFGFGGRNSHIPALLGPFMEFSEGDRSYAKLQRGQVSPGTLIVFNVSYGKQRNALSAEEKHVSSAWLILTTLLVLVGIALVLKRMRATLS